MIYNSFIGSLSANGRITFLFIFVLIIFFIFFLIFSSGDKKTSSKTKNVKQKSVKAQLLEIGEEYGTNEFVIVTITHDFESRLRSYELLAEAFSLKAR